MKAPSPHTAFLPAVLAGLFWLWLALACAHDWNTSENYSYGWFAAALAVYFLWKRVTVATRNPPDPGLRVFAWLMLLVACLSVLPLELLRQTPIYWRMFHWAVFFMTAAATLASAALLGGYPLARACLFPLIFLASAVPWPTFIEFPLTQAMMQGIASSFGDFLPLFGIPAERQGNTLVLETCTVGIEEACSGIRSLQAAVMLSLAVGEFFSLFWQSRVALFVISGVLAFIANAGRTFILTLAGLQDGETGIAAAHDMAGFVTLALLVLGVFVVAWLMKHFMGFHPPAEKSANLHIPFIGMRPVWLMIIAAAGFLLAQGWFWFHEVKRDGARISPAIAVREHLTVEARPLPPVLDKSLNPSKGTLVRLISEDSSIPNGYHFFWDESRADAELFYHRPDVCMPGGGWALDGDITEVQTHGGKARWAALPYKRGEQRGLLLWSAWLDGQPMVFDFASGASTQQHTLLRLLANGRRQFAFEVASVLVPYKGNDLPLQEALKVAESMFSIP